jgi:GH25 family lysozyme M1 (1,4-beta-N-acetylmuramidase)
LFEQFQQYKNDKEDKLKTLLRILYIALLAFFVLLSIILGILLYNSETNTAIIPANAKSGNSIGSDSKIELIKRYARIPFPLVDYEDKFNENLSEMLLYYDDTFGEVWKPLFPNVPLNPYSNENYRTAENGYKYYLEDGKIKSLVGIDVSTHQNNIDWEQVKASGVDFAMIRVGYRGYTTGDIGLDEDYVSHIKGATDAGLQVGVYFFSQAINVQEALDESELLLDAIEPYDITFPVVYDWEVIYGEEARTDETKVADFTDSAIAFCENIKNNGYVPMIYASRKLAYLKYDLSRVQDYDFWLADYNAETNYYYDYQMWQYTSTGSVPGISGNVDLNVSFVDYSTVLTPATVEEVFSNGVPAYTTNNVQ